MKFCTVDTFTKELFRGNPTAVCVIDDFPSDELMHKITKEINLSESAFVMPLHTNHFYIRWFSPITEITLCGHATLAAAHVLWNEMEIVQTDEIYFESKSGVLKATRGEKGITIELPGFKTDPISVPEGLVEALGVSPVFVGKVHDDILVELHSVEEVIQLNPDITLLKNIDCRGVIVTADGENKIPYDFVSRFFAPRIGIIEDPVTGSAHCKLAPYWAERLGKNEFKAYQASARGGSLFARVDGDLVYLTGRAVTAFKGKFLGFKDR